jgi:starch synthase
VRVLFAASEVAPLSKTGGLADVAQALPKALQRLGHDLRVVTPAYRGLLAQARACRRAGEATLRGHSFTLWECAQDGAGPPLWLVDCAELFSRDGLPYTDASGSEYPDNATRFGLFSEFVARLASGGGGANWRPDVVHLNDWHTGLAAAWSREAAPAPPCVFTIHNLAYQGNYAPAQVVPLGLPSAWMTPAGLEFHGQASFIKAGLVYADALTAVSPTYAREILTPEFGDGMDGVLRGRAESLTGILNGIDEDIWNPATDPWITCRYDIDDVDAGKRINRRALRKRLGLATDDGSLLAIYIGRLAHQKGVDHFLDPATALARPGLQFALLGSGDRTLEAAFTQFAASNPRRVAVTIAHDERLAHQMEAGADILLMPSRYEPCGLNQMYSQRYGTVPVVRRTGGLADTVNDASPAALAEGTATGICFEHANPGGIAHGIDRALALSRQPETWAALQRNAMQRDFGWTRTAGRYAELYESLAGR